MRAAPVSRVREILYCPEDKMAEWGTPRLLHLDTVARAA
uniref:Uncharacterized protein n=1 Tax=Anguilla anguilla TaxID=7936 RepID=A0A0E9UAR8_ANGAN